MNERNVQITARNIDNPFWNEVVRLHLTSGSEQELAAAFQGDTTALGVAAALMMTVAAAAILTSEEDWLPDTNIIAGRIYIAIMFVSATCNLVGVLLSQIVYSASISIPSAMFSEYLAKRGHMGYDKEPFKFVQIGFKTLLAGLVMGTYVYHGWEVCVATAVIFVAMERFYTWAMKKELQQAVDFCRGVPQG